MGSTRIQIARVVAAGAFSVAAMAGFMAPASAAQQPAVHLATAASPAATGPNTTIKGKPPTWNPTKLTIPPFTGTCSATNNSFTITNKTAKAQTILYKVGTSAKQTLGTVNAGTKTAVCGTGLTKGTKVKFFIKGAASVLTTTVS